MCPGRACAKHATMQACNMTHGTRIRIPALDAKPIASYCLQYQAYNEPKRSIFQSSPSTGSPQPTALTACEEQKEEVPEEPQQVTRHCSPRLMAAARRRESAWRRGALTTCATCDGFRGGPLRPCHPPQSRPDSQYPTTILTTITRCPPSTHPPRKRHANVSSR